MAAVKTAISLQKTLYERMDALAREMKVSRSHLLSLALEDFLRRHQNRQLQEQINAAYADVPDASEEETRRHMRATHRRIVDGEW